MIAIAICVLLEAGHSQCLEYGFSWFCRMLRAVGDLNRMRREAMEENESG